MKALKYFALPFFTVLLVGTTGFFFQSLLAGANIQEPKKEQKVSLSGKVDFNEDIRPILSKNCFFCHGPDEHQRKAKLRLDLKANALEPRDGYHIIVPGEPEKSELYLRITSDSKRELMPPHRTNKTLTSKEKALVRRWIEQGADWQDHWAFETPTRPKLPMVKNKSWVRNPIDQFILAKLEEKAMSPSPEADRSTLIRRVTLDLTGLPPTREEVKAFLNDKSENAYEKLVDRLLASPHYGEHMARFWLDTARYGDTHGLHLDNYREMWPYRDWVINAFNENLPYDQFIIHQLAGDLLVNSSTDDLVETGFNGCHVSSMEGGSIREEVFVRNVVDRVITTGSAFMGLTVGCAVCHDHKYDPVTQKEFYQLFAFFNSLDANPMDGNKAQHPPVLRVPGLEQKQRREELQKEIVKIQQEIKAKVASFKYEEPKEPAQPKLPEPKEVVWIEDDLPVGANPQGGWKWVTENKKHPVFSGKRASTRTAGPKVDQHYFTGAKNLLQITKGDVLFAYVYLDPKNPPKTIMLQFNDGTWDHRAYWGPPRINFGRDGSTRIKLGDLPKTGEWVRLEVDPAKVKLKPGAKLNGWAFTQFDGTVYWDRAGIVTMPDPSQLRFDSLAQWVEFQRKRKSSSIPKNIQAIINLDKKKRTDAQQKQLTAYFVENAFLGSRELLQPLHQKIAKLKAEMSALEKQFGTTLIWKETAKPRPAYFLKRGEYNLRGEQVSRDTPTSLPPMKKDQPKNRLGLAQWLVSAEHPLTARVAVNRFWQQYFGIGIVETSEDFGNQGARPSNQQLLDWLAVDFRENGWDVKRLQKMIVTSAAYRQSSRVTPEVFKKDPRNRFLARGPRFRLDAEMLRDQALFVSGLLVEKIGGPSVKPPQPKGLWFVVGYSGSNTVRFKADQGPEKIYRRSLYTFWKRTSPPPQMAILDAPSRESCIMRRERTNTPLQALLLMNEKQFFQAAQNFAQRILKEGGKTDTERLSWAFQTVTARVPSKTELEILTGAVQDFRKDFKENPKAAQDLIKGEVPKDMDVVEQASWTLVANTILNLHEVVTKN